MKMKKLISFLCASALTVSSFAGLTVTASAAEDKAVTITPTVGSKVVTVKAAQNADRGILLHAVYTNGALSSIESKDFAEGAQDSQVEFTKANYTTYDDTTKTGSKIFAWKDLTSMEPMTVTIEAPPAEKTELTGTPTIGSAVYNTPVTATYTKPDDALAVTYQWQIADTADGTYAPIESATNASYTPVLADIDKYIRVAVSADLGDTKYEGTVYSAPAQVAAISVTGTVSYTSGVTNDKEATAGTPVTASATLTPADAAVKYQWQNSTNGTGDWRDINSTDSTAATYTPATNDKYIRVVVTPNTEAGYTGDAINGEALQVEVPTKPLVNTVAQIAITGATTAKAGAVLDKSVTAKPEQQFTETDAFTYKWYKDNVEIAEVDVAKTLAKAPAGTYKVVATYTGDTYEGSITSEEVTLAKNELPDSITVTVNATSETAPADLTAVVAGLDETGLTAADFDITWTKDREPYTGSTTSVGVGEYTATATVKDSNGYYNGSKTSVAKTIIAAPTATVNTTKVANAHDNAETNPIPDGQIYDADSVEITAGTADNGYATYAVAVNNLKSHTAGNGVVQHWLGVVITLANVDGDSKVYTGRAPQTENTWNTDESEDTVSDYLKDPNNLNEFSEYANLDNKDDTTQKPKPLYVVIENKNGDDFKFKFTFDDVTFYTAPVTPAVTEVTTATLHDTRLDNPATAEQGIADNKLVTYYDVSEENSVVTIVAKNLKQHQNGDTTASMGYWIGAKFMLANMSSGAKLYYKALPEADKPANAEALKANKDATSKELTENDLTNGWPIYTNASRYLAGGDREGWKIYVAFDGIDTLYAIDFSNVELYTPTITWAANTESVKDVSILLNNKPISSGAAINTGDVITILATEENKRITNVQALANANFTIEDGKATYIVGANPESINIQLVSKETAFAISSSDTNPDYITLTSKVADKVQTKVSYNEEVTLAIGGVPDGKVIESIELSFRGTESDNQKIENVEKVAGKENTYKFTVPNEGVISGPITVNVIVKTPLDSIRLDGLLEGSEDKVLADADLTANVIPVAAVNSVDYQWYLYDTTAEEWKPIQDATFKTYTPAEDTDSGHTIKVVVTAKSGSDYTGKVEAQVSVLTNQRDINLTQTHATISFISGASEDADSSNNKYIAPVGGKVIFQVTPEDTYAVGTVSVKTDLNGEDPTDIDIEQLENNQYSFTMPLKPVMITAVGAKSTGDKPNEAKITGPKTVKANGKEYTYAANLFAFSVPTTYDYVEKTYKVYYKEDENYHEANTSDAYMTDAGILKVNPNCKYDKLYIRAVVNDTAPSDKFTQIVSAYYEVNVTKQYIEKSFEFKRAKIGEDASTATPINGYLKAEETGENTNFFQLTALSSNFKYADSQQLVAQCENGIATLALDPNKKYKLTLYINENVNDNEKIYEQENFALTSEDDSTTTITVPSRIPETQYLHGVTVTPANAVVGDTVTLTYPKSDDYILKNFRLVLQGTDEDAYVEVDASGEVYTGTYTIPTNVINNINADRADAHTITNTTTDENGTVTISHNGKIYTGTRVTITVTPKANYERYRLDIKKKSNGNDADLKNVTTSEDETTGVYTYTFDMPDEDITLNVTFRGKEYVAYVPNPAPTDGYTGQLYVRLNGEWDPRNGDQNVRYGEEIKYTIAPKPGYEITKVKFDGTTYLKNASGPAGEVDIANYLKGDAYEFVAEVKGNVAAPVVETRTVELNITIQTSTNGSITASYEGSETTTARLGETVKLTVNPNAHYELDELSISYNLNGIPTSKSLSDNSGFFTQVDGGYTFKMPNAPVTVSVTFVSTAPATYDVTFDLDGGNVSGETENVVKNVTAGGTVASNDIPVPTKEGYVFAGWNNGTETLTPAQVAEAAVNAAVTFTAQWTRVYSATLGEPQNGTLKLYKATRSEEEGSYTYTKGEELTDDALTTITEGAFLMAEATAAEGYQLDTLTVTPATGTAEDLDSDNTTYTFQMPAANVTVAAEFEFVRNVTLTPVATYIDLLNDTNSTDHRDDATKYFSYTKPGEGGLAKERGSATANTQSMATILSVDASKYLGKVRTATLKINGRAVDSTATKYSNVYYALADNYINFAETDIVNGTNVNSLLGNCTEMGYIGQITAAEAKEWSGDVTKAFRADSDGKITITLSTKDMRNVEWTTASIDLVLEPETIKAATATIHKVYADAEGAITIDENKYTEIGTADVISGLYQGDTYTVANTYKETIDDNTKTSRYEYVSGVGTIELTTDSETGTNDIYVIYNKIDYATTPITVTVPAAVTEDTSLTVHVAGTPTSASALAVDEDVVVTIASGETSGTNNTLKLLPGTYTYTFAQTTAYLGVNETALTVGETNTVTLTANAKAGTTATINYVTDLDNVATTTVETITLDGLFAEDALNLESEENAAIYLVTKEIKDAEAGTFKRYTIDTYTANTYKIDSLSATASENVINIKVSTDNADYYIYEGFDYITKEATIANDQNPRYDQTSIKNLTADYNNRAFVATDLTKTVGSYTFDKDVRMNQTSGSGGRTYTYTMSSAGIGSASKDVEFSMKASLAAGKGTNVLEGGSPNITLKDSAGTTLFTVGDTSSTADDNFQALKVNDTTAINAYNETDNPNGYSVASSSWLGSKQCTLVWDISVKLNFSTGKATAKITEVDTNRVLYEGTYDITSTNVSKVSFGMHNGAGFIIDDIAVKTLD